MKHLLSLIATIMLFTGYATAADADFERLGGSDKSVIGTLANETLSYDRNYYLAPGSYGMGKVSAIITYSSKTFTNVTFSTPAINMGSGNIAITGHGLNLGVRVKLIATAGTVPGPLTAETTYFAIPVTANIVQLATTSAQAISGDEILFVSSTTGATQTYTLAPLSLAGPTTMAYSGSNDGTNFFTIVSSAVAAAAFNAGNTSWNYDFSDFNYSVLKLAVTAPTAGAVVIKDSVHMKP